MKEPITDIDKEISKPLGDDRLTVGQMSDMLEEPPARVAYMIRKHRIKPIARIGIIRLFDRKSLKEIKEALLDIQIRRS